MRSAHIGVLRALEGYGVLLNAGSVSDAVMASTAIPGVFAPVGIDGRMLVDGGVVENVPVSPLPDMGADFIISVDLSTRKPTNEPGSIVEIIVNAFTILMNASAKLQTKDSDLNIQPDLSEFNIVDISQTAELIQTGYEAARDALEYRD